MTTLETLRKNEMLPMPVWGEDYLNALDKAEGYHGQSIKVMGLEWDQVYYAKQKCEAFAAKVDLIREKWRSRHLDELENISMTQAMKPGCITERIFRLKQLDPTYRDKQVGSVGGFRIILGFNMDAGPKKRRKKMEVKAAAEIT